MAASHKPHQCTACHRQFSRRHTVHQHWLKEHRGLGPWDNTRAVLVSTALTSAALPSAPASGLGAGARQKVQAVHTDVTLENIDPALLSSTSPSITAQLLGVRPADLHSTFSPNSFSPPPPAAGTTSPAIIPSTLSSPARIDSSTQFRSSRSNRHLNQDALSRNRVGGPIDHDPTEGLPINLWDHTRVTVNQDAKDGDSEDKKQSSVDPAYPWDPLGMPKDFPHLPPLSQELLLRTRRGYRVTNPMVFDKKTETWVRPGDPAAATKSPKATLADATDPDITVDEEDLADVSAAQGPKPLHNENSYDVNRWMRVPPVVAEKRPERKYLADRRPGLRSLYSAAGSVQPTAITGIGAIESHGGEVIMEGASSGAPKESSSAGLMVGDASLILTHGNEPTATDVPAAPETPKRRGSPLSPKRKKTGGLGRKKKVLIVEGEQGRMVVGVAGVDNTMRRDELDEEGDEEEESGSEEEGSEGGEFEEHEHDDHEQVHNGKGPDLDGLATVSHPAPAASSLVETSTTAQQPPLATTLRAVEVESKELQPEQILAAKGVTIAESGFNTAADLPPPAGDASATQPAPPAQPEVDLLMTLDKAIIGMEDSELEA